MEVDYSDLEFDEERYYLGSVCKRGHNWKGTGRSLRYNSMGKCVLCEAGEDFDASVRIRQGAKAREKLIEKEVEKYGHTYIGPYLGANTTFKVLCGICGEPWMARIAWIRRGCHCKACGFLKLGKPGKEVPCDYCGKTV